MTNFQADALLLGLLHAGSDDERKALLRSASALSVKQENVAPKYCCATLSAPPSAGNPTCSRSPVVERDGRWYCRFHDPVRAAERRNR